MKKLLFLLCMIATCVASQPQVVTGHLKYAGYDWQLNETFNLNYQNVTIQCSIDNFDTNEIRRLLNNCGITNENIKYIAAYGNSTTDVIEAFFIYEGVINNADQRSFINVDNKHHRKGAGYAAQAGLIVPTYNYIITDSLRNAVKLVAYKYPIKSFYVAWTLNELPFLVLGSGVINGVLADMRHVPKSYRLVPYFKEANFQIIHYRDENNAWKVLRRPVSGW